jgi:5'-nucleotidase
VTDQPAMKFSLVSATMAVSALIGSSSAISILMGNDDGFGSAQLREFYRLLKASGHEVVVVAPADNESGQGGRSVFTNNKSLVVNSEFNLVPAGAPSIGRDPIDADIWYYNGTPAACTYVGLDYVIPKFYGNRSIDLYVGGPNFVSILQHWVLGSRNQSFSPGSPSEIGELTTLQGLNAGYFLYMISGTMGEFESCVCPCFPR